MDDVKTSVRCKPRVLGGLSSTSVALATVFADFLDVFLQLKLMNLPTEVSAFDFYSRLYVRWRCNLSIPAIRFQKLSKHEHADNLICIQRAIWK